MLIYTDYLAALVRNALMLDDEDDLLDSVSVRLDLDAHGALASHRKFVETTDVFGTRYRITIEELPHA